MSKVKELQKRIKLPRVSQIGVVVSDMNRATDYYSSIFGLGPFTVYEFTPEKHWYMGHSSPLKLLMGKALWEDTELELLQPLEGSSIHQQFLNSHGEGLQHLGFNVSNYDEVFANMKAEGFQELMRTETYVDTYDGNLKACYFDTRRIGGVIFEIIWKSWLPECQEETQ